MARPSMMQSYRRRRRARILRRAVRDGLPPGLERPLRYFVDHRLDDTERRAVERVEQMRTDLAARAGETVPILYSPKPGSAGTEATPDLRPAHGEVHTFDLERVANQTSVGAGVGAFLYLCAASKPGGTVIELGSCAGIGSAYLASADVTFIGIEGSSALAAIAHSHVAAVNSNAEVVNGLFDEVLDQFLTTRFRNGIDVAWIDGHHERVATAHYLQRLQPALNVGAIVLFDDIRWSQDMFDGWNDLSGHEGFAHTIDLGSIGAGVWDGGDRKPQVWDLADLRYRPNVGTPHGWGD